MKLTRTEEVAILIATSVAQSMPERISLSDISKLHGISLLFLKKIARELHQAGILVSKEGIGGGYILAKPAGDISIFDVFSCIGSFKKEEIMFEPGIDKVCPIQPDCIPQKIRKYISNAFITYCKNITLDQLMRKN